MSQNQRTTSLPSQKGPTGTPSSFTSSQSPHLSRTASMGATTQDWSITNWKDVKREVAANRLQRGQVLVMKGLTFHPNDTNIKLGGTTVSASRRRNRLVNLAAGAEPKASGNVSEKPDFDATPLPSLSTGKSTVGGTSTSSVPPVAQTLVATEMPTQTSVMGDKPAAVVRQSYAAAVGVQASPSQSGARGRGAGPGRAVSRGSPGISPARMGATSRPESSTVAETAAGRGSLSASSTGRGRSTESSRQGPRRMGAPKTGSQSSRTPGTTVSVTVRGVEDLVSKGSKNSSRESSAQSTKAELSAQGLIPHHAIILEVKEDHIIVASTTTFGKIESLNYMKNGEQKKAVRDESMVYYLAVFPAKREKGMSHDEITMEKGMEKAKWVYLRWANKMNFDDMIAKGEIASVDGPTSDVYGLETVEKIIEYICENGLLDPDERKEGQGVTSGNRGEGLTPASGQPPAA